MRHNVLFGQLWSKFAQNALLAIVAVAAFGCSDVSKDQSATKHDADTPTRGDEAWMWMAVESTKFEQSLGQLLGVSGFLAADHVLVKRTQFWLDRFDAQLRAAHPAALAMVPKPNAKVVKLSSPNAFVAPVPVCYKLDVKVAGGTANAANTVDTVLMDLATGELSALPSEINCYEGPNDVATIKSVVAKHNSSGQACKYTVNASNVLMPNASCSRHADIEGVVKAKQVAILQTANWVTVHAGLFMIMSEETFASVLAHELGHYYRSHITASKPEYDFFYTAEENQPAHRPVAEPDRQAFGQRAVESSTWLNAADMHRSLPSSDFRSELFFAAGSVVLAVCDEGDCPAKCAGAKTFIESAAFDNAIGTFPFGVANADEGDAYEMFETKVKACFADLDLATGWGTLNSSEVSFDRIKDAIRSPAWPTWRFMLAPGTQRKLAGLADLVALNVGTSVSGTNVKDAFAKASAALASRDESDVLTLKLAVTERLGQYTAEQEADDEAAEWVAETGLEPKYVVEAMRNLGKGGTTSMRGMLLGQQDCDALRSNDWRNTDGSYVFVPVGDFSEIHHSICYRMFNLEREIDAHSHEPASISVPILTAAQWTVLQHKAEQVAPESLGGEGGTPDDAFFVSPIVRRTKAFSCPYANRYF